MTKQKPLSLDLHALGRHPGEQLARHLELPAPPDLAVGMIGVPEGSPVVLDLTCQSAGDGILVEGTAQVGLRGQCARCLADFDRQQTFDLQELYFYPGRGPEPDEIEEGDVNYVEDEAVDLDPLLREAIVLSLPFSPLCRPDCAGLCPVCGADLNEQPGHAHDAPTDARWADLQSLVEPVETREDIG